MNLLELRLIIAPLLQGTPFQGKTYFAGGCVRDFVLDVKQNLSPDYSNTAKGIKSGDLVQSDVDLCVNLPEGGIKLARFLAQVLKGERLSTHPKFGTASFTYQGIQLEFVATRKETYFPGSRYPAVQFGSLEDDVLRRDFTINAMLMDVSTAEMLDLSGWGLQDLEHKYIRCVGDPITKFQEDPLRMLRAIRFGLRFGFMIELQTVNALQVEVNELQKLSTKQIETELSKMLIYSSKEDIAMTVCRLGWLDVLKVYNASIKLIWSADDWLRWQEKILGKQ